MIDSRLRRDMQVPSSCKQICLVNLDCLPDAELSNTYIFLPHLCNVVFQDLGCTKRQGLRHPSFGSEVILFLGTDLSIQSN